MFKKIINKFFDKTFNFWQVLGFHISPVHFYRPTPDTRKLKKNLWQKKSDLIGIDFNVKKQLELLSVFVKKFKSEYDVLSKNKPDGYNYFNVKNSEFGPVDAEIFYCMIRHFKPRRIIEIGSGYSTLIAIMAIEKNKEEFAQECQLTSVDPYPKDFVKNIKQTFFNLIEKEVQDVDINEFNKLKENDILFIDSSHMLKIGSDVQYEYLEILPRLNRGVLVHSHDIFLPSEYSEDWVLNEHLFFNEQYLLQAFLTFNKEFEILWGGNYINSSHQELLERDFYSYSQKIVPPSSFWIKRL